MIDRMAPLATRPTVPSAAPLDAIAIATVLVMCMSWGVNQVAIKLTLAEVPPLIQSAIRSTGGALVVWLWALARGVSLDIRDGTLSPGVWAGLLFGLEFICIYQGLQWTTASRTSLFLYFAPFVVAIGGRWLLPGDRLRPMQVVGLVLSFSGLVVVFGVPGPAANPHQWIGDVLAISAAVLWGATTLLIKASSLNRAPFEKTLLYQLVVSAPMLALAAWIAGEAWPTRLSTATLGLLAYQTFWVVSVTFLVWFAMIQRYSANRLSAFTFLTPLFGVAAGHLILGDPLTPAFAAAVGLVAAGLILVNRSR